MTRVIVSVYYQPQDYTVQAALVGLINGLEPIAGVINACLPFLPLVFKRTRDTQFFIRASSSFKSIMRKTSKNGNTTVKIISKPDRSKEFKELTDIEMNPFKISNYGKSFVETPSQNSVLQNGTWDKPGHHNGIFVRKDFTLENEVH